MSLKTSINSKKVNKLPFLNIKFISVVLTQTPKIRPKTYNFENLLKKVELRKKEIYFFNKK